MAQRDRHRAARADAQFTDYYIDYTLGETIRQLTPFWRQALAAGQPVADGNPAGVDYLISRVTTAELLKLPRTEKVQLALLSRLDVQDVVRLDTLASLADLRGQTQAAVLLDALETDGNNLFAANIFARLLTVQAADDLKLSRHRIARQTAQGPTLEVRHAAWAALALADESIQTVWNEAAQSPNHLAALLSGIPLLLDQDLRLASYDKVVPFLTGTPAPLQEAMKGKPSSKGRYVRIELPRTGTLTLAEVEVFSKGRNIAPGGRARQSSTAHGGAASRAIDGRTDGNYASGAQTHTQENTSNPWWEVDLGQEQEIEAVLIWNRTDGSLGERLDGFTLRILDQNRQEVFHLGGNLAPKVNVRIETGRDLAGALRRAAIHAAVSIPCDEEATFAALAHLIEQGDQVPSAAQGIRILPRAFWCREKGGQAARALVAWAGNVPPQARTLQDYVETVQVAEELAGLLPSDQAAVLRRDLRELRVAVFVLRAVREQMRFDTPRIVVEAGKPFELVVENPDFMPHNLVIVNPGTRPTIGMMAGLMRPDQFDRRGRPYVPDSPDVLEATKLLEAGQREVLKMVAPETEGNYEFVCTFPGHWENMWGWLIVTRDVDAYLEKNPVAPQPQATHGHSHHGH